MTKISDDLDPEIAGELARLRRRVEDLERAQGSQLFVIVENFAYGLAWYDAKGRLVGCNKAYKATYAIIADELIPGVEFNFILRKLLENGWFSDALDREEEWLTKPLP
ncbi:MAG: PAS-domain containing protein [Alphaproteobacteria bacterium]|nr:PAS-domain containing protein [Alphaproteobacteria bacterium]